MRIFGHGLKFFTGTSNVFDFTVVIISIAIALLKVLSDVLMDLRFCAQFNIADQCKYPNLLPSDSPECKSIQDAMAEENEQGLGFVGATPRLLRQIGVVLRLVRIVGGILRARRLKLELQEKIRQAVAAKKRRYHRDGFDLDVSYITDRCLAMSTPGFGAHKGYRNDMAEVSRFFNLYHYGKYRIYNLCEEFEGNYHPAMLFFQMRRYAFDDHNAPTLKQIMAFCHNALEFQAKDPENVIAVHCKGGKGRTGVMVCCWLLISGHRSIALDALELFAFRRTVKYYMNNHDNQTAEAPSQVRYVHYLEAILYNHINPAAEPTMLLRAIELRNVPGPIFLSVMVFAKGGVLYDSRKTCDNLPCVQAGDDYVWDIPVTLVHADVKIEVFRHENKSPLSARIGTQKYDSKVEKWPWCQVAFHTLLHHEETLIEYEKMQIDYCHKDRKHEKFPGDFGIALHFLSPAVMGGYALTLNHPGSLKRSKFASFDASIVFGSFSVLVQNADGLNSTLSEGAKVKVEIEGVEVTTTVQRKNGGSCEWQESLQFVSSTQNILAKVTVYDRRGLVDVAIGEGQFAVLREELQTAARKEKVSAYTGKKGSDDSGKGKKESPWFSKTIDLDPVNSGQPLVQMVKRPSRPGSKGAKRLRSFAGNTTGTVQLCYKYQSWDMPKEYWDRHSFCDLIRQVGRRETAYPGQEIIAAGESKRRLYMVLSGVVHVQIRRYSADGEHILVDMLGENAIFGAFSFLEGKPEMQHLAYTTVELAVIDLHQMQTEKEAVESAPTPKKGDAVAKEAASKAPKAGDGMTTREKVLFYKVLALVLSEKFQTLKNENFRIIGRVMQSDDNESLQNQVTKQELRNLCIQKFFLPATDQCLYVGNAVKVWMRMPNAPTETHFRCRLIVLSSIIVMEPTLKGTLFLDATYDKHTIDASRILSVREVSDDGPGEIIVAYSDLNAHYDNCLMAIARHAVQELRLLFHDPMTKRHCTELLRKMARDTAASREKEKMIKSVLGGDSTMPSLEKMLSKAVFAGLLKKYEANCEIDDFPPGSLVYVVRGSIRVTNSQTSANSRSCLAPIVGFF